LLDNTSIFTDWKKIYIMHVSVKRSSESVSSPTSFHGILTGYRRIADFINTEHLNVFLLQLLLQFNFVQLCAHANAV
jgi:hypothetical protein